MPIAKVKLPDGRIAKFEVPDGTTPEQVTAFAEQNMQTFDQPELQQEPEQSYLGETISNVPGSAAQFGKNIYQAVTNPVETIKAIGQAGAGFMQATSPHGETTPQTAEEEEIALFGQKAPEDAQAYESLKSALDERYGSLDKAAETLKTDPVGFMVDISSVLSGVGGLFAKTPGVVGKFGEVTKTAGEAANPINLVKEATTAIPRKIIPKGSPQKFAQGMVEKQLKPSTTLRTADRQEMLTYMLENGVNVSKGGLSKLENKLSSNNKMFDNLINGAAKKGDTVSVDSVSKHLNRTRETFSDSLFAEDLLPHVDRAEELLTTHRNTVGGRMPIEKARAMKTDLQKALKGAYGELSSITDEAMKDIVHGINEQIWEKFPILKEAGQEMKVQIALERELERAVNRLGNNNAISLQDLGLGGGLGAASGNVPLAVGAGLTNKVLRMPQVKGTIARAINKVGKEKFKGRQSGEVKKALKNLSISGRTQD